MKTSAKQAPPWETWATPPVPSQEIRSQSEEAVVPDELQEGYPVAVEAALGSPWAIHVPQHSAQEKLLPMKKLLLAHHHGLLERLPKA